MSFFSRIRLPAWAGILTLILGGILLASGCATEPGGALKSGGSDYGHYPSGGGLYVSAAFGPDGRLWRVVPEKRHVYVDYSTDQGKTFSAPVALNAEAQRIKVSGENRPGIAVDPAGRIYAVYAAEGKQPSALYVSVSSDGGQHFSPPALLSDKAAEANTYQAKLALSPSGQAYAFWHDERDRFDWKKPGNAIYYTTIAPQAQPTAQAWKVIDAVCECCRLAAAFDTDGGPVLSVRFLYPGGVRDHALLRPKSGKSDWTAWRVSVDDWKVDACPEHGPALAIGKDGRQHMAWFTQGTARKGLFYANSSDRGQHYSTPVAVGDMTKLPSHPDLLVLGQRVALAWSEYDGTKTRIMLTQSQDGGTNWSPARSLAETSAQADYPLLLAKGGNAFLSWNSQRDGYRLIRID
jgi:hypothetical protein